MITGCLQEKNNTYYAVLYIKVDGKRKPKWVSIGLPVAGTSDRKAQKAFDQIRLEYEQEQVEKERREAEERARELIEGKRNPQADVLFTNYLQKWLTQSRPTIAKTTFKGYQTMLDGRISRYFTELNITLGEVTPQHIQDFHQSIFDEGYTPNTVIHYHAVLRRALQNAVKKGIISSNPADRVDRPKKNVYHAQFYSAGEMMALFDAISDDPLEICVKLAAYYGLRRSEVLGLKWDAINLEQKTISIKHKVIEDTVDGKSIAVGEDVLKTKSSFRTLPLLPSVEKLLLAEKEKQEMYRKRFKRSYCCDYLDYICLDQTGKLMRPNYVTDHFSGCLKKPTSKKSGSTI
ncbi:phage integrase SAM-like domain-containing protein [Clostridium boliviensis]|uniref:Phage integrase SAM-like domain-containing protein n=1 Tax=Clostridium boliviensis TaxID=318465 RepID=A0ABU4GHX1_9CLOT|nr:phage integrase SAM-like domain-containing protein [Clostridium boliviensis]MDW2797219.1 phage integrase SAM-like domain-containing protein [Clostridium boliviensis]